ncbi:M48 family metalloprotease [Streptomyces sp. IBSNAI002]|uniref:M48 family metalloprotease n=1 Tax=Streptomyces sp. IBSNAI002 TaxID=3457500 RepID=UPI003FCF6104
MDSTRHPEYPPHAPLPAQTDPGLDDLEYHHAPGTRVFHRARQRGADVTAWGRLALQMPGFLLSLGVVVLVALLVDAWVGLPYWLPTALWLASGTLAFHRPSERFLARHLLGLQRPLPHELAHLTPVWREVSARAGIDGSRYELWIEDSPQLNAYAAAGHIVGVTRHAVEKLPKSQLAAVLAHELGHHTGGHAWAGLLGWWYGLPGRITWRTLAHAVVRTIRLTMRHSLPGAALLVLALGLLACLTVKATYGLPLLLLLVPCLMAALARRAELRADAHAAVLGFAPVLAAMLLDVMARDERRAELTAPPRYAFARSGPLVRLLATHPDHRTRLHHLEPYLRSRGQTP